MIAALIAIAATKLAYRFEASFVESCSCKDVCITEITGRDAGCHGLTVMHFSHGSYGGHNFSGTSAAWAFDSGKWVHIYIDAPQAKRPVLTAFLRAMLADWGPLEPVTLAPVSIRRKGKNYVAGVNGDREALTQVAPVFGGDGHTPVTHANLTSPLHSILMQGETRSAHYNGGEHHFDLAKTNGFFNPKVKMSGRI